MDVNGKALDSMFNDMDDMESKKMFGEKEPENQGVTVTISVSPNGEVSQDMNKGGEVCMSDGGVVQSSDDDDVMLPPYLRKKKKTI